MTMRWFPPIFYAFALFNQIAQARGEDTPASSLKQLEQLEILQSRMAFGDKSAVEGLATHLAVMGSTLAKASAADWKDSRYTEAGVRFLLAGGSPRVIEQLAGKHAFLKAEPLLMGALAYITGHESEAREKLETIKPAALRKSLGAQTAFMISIVTTASNLEAAIELLDLARTLSPGGLLEEAALRREIILLTKSKDTEKALRLLRQYLARFSRSLFAEKFFQELVALIPETGIAESIDDIRKLRPFLEALLPGHRRGLLLSIARKSLLDGRMDVAQAAASAAIEMSGGDSAESAAGHLYRAAARLADSGDEATAADLLKIEAAKLPRRDLLLLAGAKEIAKRQRGDTGAPGVTAGTADADTRLQEETAKASTSRAETAISRADRLLEK